MGREKFGSRLGFILISAGCAIGLGNVWRFPYITSQYGGGAFILLYFIFLIIFGLPIMTMEFAVGRASQKSITDSFKVLEPKGTKWHTFGWIGAAGNYLLMMFYTTVSGWMFIYFIKSLKGDFAGQDYEAVSGEFGTMISNPGLLVGFMALVVVLGFLVCSLGLEKGVEKVTKIMMILLFVLLVIVAVRVVTLPEAKEGLTFYLIPNFKNLTGNFADAVFAAMGQAFFTLSIGMGSMAIFGSYIKKDRSLLGEAATIAGLDTFVAFMAGLIVIPASFMFAGEAVAGPGLLFQVTPNIFNTMPGSSVWSALFFLFMIFAAMSTVVAVFENIISFGMDSKGWSRKKSCAINLVAVLILSVPCALGFNLLADFQPLGADTGVLDLEDFIISNNILPLGSLIYVLFCTSKKFGWGWDNFIGEANTGNGLKLSKKLYYYCKFVLPVLIVVLWVWGVVSMFI